MEQVGSTGGGALHIEGEVSSRAGHSRTHGVSNMCVLFNVSEMKACIQNKCSLLAACTRSQWTGPPTQLEVNTETQCLPSIDVRNKHSNHLKRLDMFETMLPEDKRWVAKTPSRIRSKAVAQAVNHRQDNCSGLTSRVEPLECSSSRRHRESSTR